MKRAVEKSALFQTDVTRQFGWYLDAGGETLAWRFFEAADLTLGKLATQPELGRVRHFRHPLLQDLRSFRVEPPFDRLLIFYRSTENTLQAWRLMHGARNLPRRLAEPPES